MSQDLASARLKAALWECDRHLSALAEALADWQSNPDGPELRFAALLATVEAAQTMARAYSSWKLKLPA